MPKCKNCGKTMWTYTPAERDAGLCENCMRHLAEKEKKAAVVRANNLDICRQHGAKANVQRIFDGFTAKYPDALITGISVLDDGQKLLVYLDGKPMYYVTHNPLTNSVDLANYQEVMAKNAAAKQAEARQASAAAARASRDKNAGCSVFLSIVGVVYGLLCMLFSTIGGLAVLVCSLIVLAGGIAKSRFAVILGGALSLAAAFVAAPYTVPFALFGIFYLCVGADM